MERERLEQLLAQAERHVAEGVELVERQRELIDKIFVDRYLTHAALELLNQLEMALEKHIADRDRLRAELNDLVDD